MNKYTIGFCTSALLLAACADEYEAQPQAVQDGGYCEETGDEDECQLCMKDECCEEYASFLRVGNPLFECFDDCGETSSCLASCKRSMPALAKLFDTLSDCSADYCYDACRD